MVYWRVNTICFLFFNTPEMFDNENPMEGGNSPAPEASPEAPAPQQQAPATPPPPPAAPAAPTPPPASGGNYCGFWIRLLGLVIDGVILGVISYLLFGSQSVGCEVLPDGGFSCQFLAYSNSQILVPIAYTLGFWIWKSTTPGKMLFGMKIVDSDGNNLTPVKAILRYVGYVISIVPLFLGFLWVAFDKEKQGFHDKIAGTHVVR